MQILFALSAVSCLGLGIFITYFFSVYFEQRVFTLIVFSTLQLLPLVFALRLPSLRFGRTQWISVALYFFTGMIANFFFPQLKQYLAWVFYAFCTVVILLACAAGGMVIRSAYVRPTLHNN